MGKVIDRDQSVVLIQKLQKNKISIKEERLLLAEIEARYRPHLKTNYLYDPDEIKAEYIMATWNALFRAKLNIGDPIAFACNRGKGAMLDYYRKISSEKLILFCPSCHNEYTYDRRNIFCKKTNCRNYQLEGLLQSREKEILMPATDFNESMSISDSYTETIILNEILEDIIQYIQHIDEIKSAEKKMIISAIQYRQDFYDYARSIGKSHSFSVSFKNKMNKFLQSFKQIWI